MSYINNVTAAIAKFQESTHYDPALAEALTQILEARRLSGGLKRSRPALWSEPERTALLLNL